MQELFCVGINDVTRTLENMPRIEVSSLEEKKSRQSEEASDGANCKERYVHVSKSCYCECFSFGTSD